MSKLILTGRVATEEQPIAPGERYFSSWVPADKVPPGHRRHVRRLVDHAARAAGLGRMTIRWFGPVKDPRDRAIVEAMRKAAAGIDGPIDWYIPEGANVMTGRPQRGGLPVGLAPDDMPMTIALHVGLRGDALRAVIAHEVRHVAQRLEAEAPADPEADADAFALDYLITSAEPPADVEPVARVA